MLNKQIKLFKNNNTIVLTDIDNFYFLDYEEEDVKINSNTTEIKGVDGLLVGKSSFSPFNLELHCVFDGVNIKDYHLFKSKLRGIVYDREPYYVWHSDMPGKKYAVIPDSIDIEDKFGKNGEFTIKFIVYKGYSESLDDTSQFSISNGRWQFEQGVTSLEDAHYSHDHWGFRIYNGSSDTVNPVMGHNLKIKIHAEAPKGFSMKNETTGDIFEYKEPLNYSNELTIDGVHSYMNNKERVGKYTNYEWITLAPGYNQIVITGEGVKKIQTEWIFNFIYR